jgi:hypothetical protein
MTALPNEGCDTGDCRRRENERTEGDHDVRMIRRGWIVKLVLVAMAMAAPAAAHVAEVTTAVPLADVQDDESLRRSIGQAVERARAETIAFVPSLVAVTGVRVLGEHVLIGLLFADDEGEAMLEELQGAPGGEPKPEEDDPGADRVKRDAPWI